MKRPEFERKRISKGLRRRKKSDSGARVERSELGQVPHPPRSIISKVSRGSQEGPWRLIYANCLGLDGVSVVSRGCKPQVGQ